MKEIESLSRELYADIPMGTLYHYTTFSGLLGIVRSRALWASDVRYMNDSAELRHTSDLIRAEVQERVDRGLGNGNLLSLFADWVAHRITNGHMLFGASFRSHGNLLSQWRGYSSPGKGVSLGFCPDYILECAQRQRFMIGKCIYEPHRQKALITQVVNAVEQMAENEARGEDTASERASLFRKAFASIEIDLLRIAAILKHPSFREEKEWRIVSPVIANTAEAPILFREGHAMLVPYIEFDLGIGNKPPVMDHLYLGPTANINISMNSLKMFLEQNGIVPKRGIDYCQIPFRQR
nr:DUF2971 domain-containing protein [uncultured Desulfobulbus sp.]